MRVRVKICGLTSAADALAAAEAGADYLGFVLFPGSPRYVEPARLREIAARLPAEVPRVGIFVNAAVDEMRRVAELCGLGIIQLHGDEPAATARELGSERVWKAVALAGADGVTAAEQYPAKALVVDAMTKDARGGTGRTADWGLAACLAQRRAVVLAGGLRPENVASAIAKVRPFAVDVSSGVESRPGCKDPARVRAFIDAVRRCAADTDAGAARESPGAARKGVL